MVENELGKPDSRRWVTEGDGLYASAMTVRSQWIDLRKAMRDSSNESDHPIFSVPNQARTWSELEGLPRASMLLLGYAVEMYLKAGLAKAYFRCRTASNEQDGLFDRDIRRFGHDYVRLAAAVEFEASVQDIEGLDLLSRMVVDSARYPLMPARDLSDKNSARFDDLNTMKGTIWSAERFNELQALVQRVRDYIQIVDGDSKLPASFGRFVPIDSDGYLVSRTGGHLSPRIVFRYSTEMVNSGLDTLEGLREVIGSDFDHVVQWSWNRALILEDGAKKTVVRQGGEHFAPGR